jgi:hypothetical protein
MPLSHRLPASGRVSRDAMDKLTENHFSFKCPMNWDEMQVSENGRYCGKCRKEVLDLTGCSIDEVIALQRKHGAICGSIRVAVAAVSLTAAACHSSGHGGRLSGTPLAPHQMEKKQEVMLPGTLCPPEQLEKMKQR